MEDLNKALTEYNNNNFEKAYLFFKTYRQKIENKNSFDKYYSFKFIKTIYETKIKHLEKIDKEVQEEIIYIIKHLTPKDFYYKLTIFKVIENLENKNNVDYNKILTWLKKLDINYLSDNNFTFEINGKTIESFSEIEKYYLKLTKTYEKLKDYDNLLLSSKEALEKVKSFTNNSNIWIKRRIAVCYYKKQMYSNAIEIYKEILLIKKDWYIYREIANIYKALNNKDKMFYNYFEAFSNSFDVTKIINLIHEMFLVLENLDLKRKFYLLFLALKSQSKNKLSDNDILERDKLNISEKEILELNIEKYFRYLKNKINDLKTNYQTRYRGYIVNVNDKFCFIESDNQRYFCKIKEFPKNIIPTKDMNVEFSLVESFDKKKNQKSLIATNIKII